MLKPGSWGSSHVLVFTIISGTFWLVLFPSYSLHGHLTAQNLAPFIGSSDPQGLLKERVLGSPIFRAGGPCLAPLHQAGCSWRSGPGVSRSTQLPAAARRRAGKAGRMLYMNH